MKIPGEATKVPPLIVQSHRGDTLFMQNIPQGSEGAAEPGEGEEEERRRRSREQRENVEVAVVGGVMMSPGSAGTRRF